MRYSRHCSPEVMMKAVRYIRAKCGSKQTGWVHDYWENQTFGVETIEFGFCDNMSTPTRDAQGERCHAEDTLFNPRTRLGRRM
jgi:hypothetical protein